VAVTEKYLLAGSNQTLMSTELNALASSTGPVAGALSSASSSNVPGDGKGDGYPLMNLELKVTPTSGTFTAGTAAYVWFLTNVSTLETGSGSLLPGRPPDAIIPITALGTAATQVVVTVKGIVAPASGQFWTLFAHNLGQTLAGGGVNVLTAQYYTRQGV